MKLTVPKAVLRKSSTSSSGIDTAFSMRRKRAGRWSAVVAPGFLSVVMSTRCRVHAIDVVHAADVQEANAFAHQRRIQINA